MFKVCMAVFLEKNFCVSAIPGRNPPKGLIFDYQNKVIQSLRIYFSKFSDSAKINLTSQINKLSTIDHHRRFSPAIYGIYVRVKDAYHAKDIEGILDALQEFTLLNEESFYAENLQYSSILSEVWERPFVQELREQSSQVADVHISAKKNRILPLLLNSEVEFPPKELRQCKTILQELDTDLYEEFTTYVSRIKLYSSKTLASTSSPRFFGAIYLRLPFPHENPLLYYLEQLVHEVSHLHLFVLMSEDPLVLNPDELHDSPLRVDKRPMVGILHATFVLARIVRILRKYFEAYDIKDNGQLEEQIGLLREGMSTVLKFGKLNDQGKQLYNTLEACAFE